jgi:hypothetical protein
MSQMSQVSETSNTDSASAGKAPVQDLKVAEREQKLVVRSKALVILVLLVAVAAVSSSIYLLLSKEEEDDFEAQVKNSTFVAIILTGGKLVLTKTLRASQFQNYANQIIAVSQSNAISSFETIESFAVSISSYASDTNKVWPFVTVPDFAARADRIATQVHASRFAFAPIVESQQLGAWYNYSDGNRAETFRDDVEYLGLNKTISSAEALYARTAPRLFALNFSNLSNPRPDWNIGAGPWAPFWQGYPIPAQPITNYDLISGENTGPSYYVTAATLAPTLNFVINPDATNEEEFNYVSESVLVQPIFEKVINKYDEDIENKKMVGFVWVVINWIFYFTNLLPDSANGVILVLKSSCNDTITYQINGLGAEQLGDPVDGNGDVHDPYYDDLKISAPFFSFEYDRDKIPEGTCVPELTLHIYPSAELEDEFLTNEPVYYAIAVVLIFFSTTIVFIIYDCMVRRHQTKVMARVYRQDRIVSDMFPTAIRKRMYGEGDGEGKNNRGGDKDLFDPDDLGNDQAGEIIAELYPGVSLVFADICKFCEYNESKSLTPSEMIA